MKTVSKVLGVVAATAILVGVSVSDVRAGGSYSFGFGYNSGGHHSRGYGGHYGAYYGSGCRPYWGGGYSFSYAAPRVYYTAPPVVYYNSTPPPVVYSQPAPPAAPPAPLLGLSDIKALVKAGVADEVIISQIKSTRAAYRLTTAEIIDLKDSGVSGRVIDFMINTASQ